MRSSSAEPPIVIAVAGPNGAGKSTAAPMLLRGALDVTTFLNADVIAQGLAAYDPDSAAIAAGRALLARMRELCARRANFAFETTLAGRSYEPWLRRLLHEGYQFQLHYLWLPSADAAVQRVRERVATGGHNVPIEVIRRRYAAGIRNFHGLYRPLATLWRMYDNGGGGPPRLVARGAGTEISIVDHLIWESSLLAAGAG